ncbi:MAG: hypothetical protein ACRDY3_07580 [Acidimicrobiales bacterium]
MKFAAVAGGVALAAGVALVPSSGSAEASAHRPRLGAAHHRHGSSKATKAELKARLLTISDLPAGWSVSHTSPTGGIASSQCVSGLASHKHGPTATASFSQGNTPVLDELLSSYQAKRWAGAVRKLDRCKSLAVTEPANAGSLGASTQLKLAIGQLSFPAVADGSHSWSLSASATGLTLGADVVAFHAGRYAAIVLYADLGSPDITAVESMVDAAAKKLEPAPQT